MKKILIKIKKKIFRAVLYIFYPERCIPRIIHYDGHEWYLAEGELNEPAVEKSVFVGYIRFVKKETIRLFEVRRRNRWTAYRRMHRWLLMKKII
jgi:hypothetical protein